MTAGAVVEIEPAAIRLLAGREHSRAELTRKLTAKGYTEDLIAPVLDDLERRGLLSDERFAEQYVAMRLRKGYGPVRIRAELRERGVAPDQIRQALDEPGYDWRELLQQASRSRFGDMPPADRRDVAKRARFLTHRGFQESLIRELLLGEVS